MTISRIVFRGRLLWQQLAAKIYRRTFQPLAALDEATLQQIQREAELLRTHYGVEVRALGLGEKPDIPRPAEEAGHSTFQP